MLSIFFDGIEYRFFNHNYAVSRCGKALRKLSPYTPPQRTDGYFSLGRQTLLHRVIAMCWIPNDKCGLHVHHRDGDKTNNHADNLEWISHEEHARLHSKGRPGYKRTTETIAKFIASRTGVKDSPQSAAVKRKNLDKVRPSTVCKFQGVTYPSVASAARAAGIPTPTFRVRAISKNFPEYEIVRLYYGSPDI